MAVVSVSEAKQYLNLTTSDHDSELQLFVDAVTAVIERHIGKVVEQRTFVEDVVLRGVGSTLLSRGPIVSITSATTTDGYVTWDPETLVVDTSLGSVSSRSLFNGTVRFTYVAGMEPVPPHIRLAALIIVGHLWETQRPTVAAAPGIGGFDDGGTSLAPSVYGYAIPNRALELLGPAGVTLA